MDLNGDVGIIAGEQLLIKLGDGNVPETFTHSCLVNTKRAIKFKSNMTETEVRSCTDPTKPARIVRKVKSIDFSVDGAGKTDATSVWAFIAWWKSGLPKNCIVTQNVTGAEGGWSGTGKLILGDFGTEGEAGDFQDFSASFAPADVFDWEVNA
jgi:5-deoxy-D-glucuronate isomerase